MCDASIAMAMDYAEQRVQFDKPIASHQVIQHKLVDMLHATELGRVGVHYAAWASDTGDADAARAASIAKAQMGEAAVMVTGENIQVHGAVGFTWDSRAGVLYQRAKQNDVLGGGRSWHRRRVADLVLDGLADGRPAEVHDRRGRRARRTCAPATRCTSWSGTRAGAPRSARSCGSGGTATRASRS